MISGQQRYALRRPDEGWPFDDLEVSVTFAELIEFLAESEGLAWHAQPDLVRLNLRVFHLLHERRLIHFEHTTLADND